jgi:hypothetical protein
MVSWSNKKLLFLVSCSNQPANGYVFIICDVCLTHIFFIWNLNKDRMFTKMVQWIYFIFSKRNKEFDKLTNQKRLDKKNEECDVIIIERKYEAIIITIVNIFMIMYEYLFFRNGCPASASDRCTRPNYEYIYQCI